MKTFRDVYGNEYGSKHIGSIDCNHRNLESLKGAPTYVSGHFNCFNNNLQTLEGAPIYIGGDFYCDGNKNLKSLDGAPIYVGGVFYCANDKLESLKGVPKYIGGEFACGSRLLHGEILYTVITSLIRGRYNRYLKEGEQFKNHILTPLVYCFTRRSSG